MYSAVAPTPLSERLLPAADDGVVDGSDGPNGSDALLRATCATEGTSAAGSRYSRASHCTVA